MVVLKNVQLEISKNAIFVAEKRGRRRNLGDGALLAGDLEVEAGALALDPDAAAARAAELPDRRALLPDDLEWQ